MIASIAESQMNATVASWPSPYYIFLYSTVPAEVGGRILAILDRLRSTKSILSVLLTTSSILFCSVADAALSNDQSNIVHIVPVPNQAPL
jgi:hypothetical protein